MASDGTPLEALETGEIQNTADEGRMRAILSDMNVPNEGNTRSAPPQAPPSVREEQPMQPRQPMPSMPPMPPMMSPQFHPNMNMQQQRPPQYMPQQKMMPPPQYMRAMEEEEPEEPVEAKKNIWSTVAEQIRDPILVICIFFLLSLPVFHTFLGQYATWAFAVGGQLSYLGLAALSLLSGLLFAAIRLGCTFAGI